MPHLPEKPHGVLRRRQSAAFGRLNTMSMNNRAE
jgi:hypothetical protein